MSHPCTESSGVMQAAMNSLMSVTATTGGLIQTRAQNTASNGADMWSHAMTGPTINSSLGYRTATESGSGVERRLPDTGISSGN